MNIPINLNPIFKKEYTKEEYDFIEKFENANNSIATYIMGIENKNKIRNIFLGRLVLTSPLNDDGWNKIKNLFHDYKKNGNLEYIKELESYRQKKRKENMYYIILNFKIDREFAKSVITKGYLNSLDNARI